MELKNKLLIAPPAIKESFWYKTVIYVTEHHPQGSVGIVLNKRSQMSVTEFADQCGFKINVPGYIYLGGPVNIKALSMLHTSEWKCSNTMKITPRLSISSAEDLLAKMAMGDRPKHWRMFLGLCGWSVGQLEDEVRGNPPRKHDLSWLIANPDLDLLFESDNADQWNQSVELSGKEFAQSILI